MRGHLLLDKSLDGSLLAGHLVDALLDHAKAALAEHLGALDIVVF